MAVSVVNPNTGGSAIQPSPGVEVKTPASGSNGSVSTGVTVSTSPGPAGRNAYELAVAQGFVGTLEQWLESLEGAEGPPGPPGEAEIPDLPNLTLIFENGLI